MPISKKELIKANIINIYSFLLGIWHFCITSTNNKDGKETFEYWCYQNGNRLERECEFKYNEKYDDIQLVYDIPESKKQNMQDTKKLQKKNSKPLI